MISTPTVWVYELYNTVPRISWRFCAIIEWLLAFRHHQGEACILSFTPMRGNKRWSEYLFSCRLAESAGSCWECWLRSICSFSFLKRIFFQSWLDIKALSLSLPTKSWGQDMPCLCFLLFGEVLEDEGDQEGILVTIIYGLVWKRCQKLQNPARIFNYIC